MDFGVASFAQADEIFLNALAAPRPFNEVVNFYPSWFSAENATGGAFPTVSFIYPVSHILGDMGKVF
jgi:hypothetical protein